MQGPHNQFLNSAIKSLDYIQTHRIYEKEVRSLKKDLHRHKEKIKGLHRFLELCLEILLNRRLNLSIKMHFFKSFNIKIDDHRTYSKLNYLLELNNTSIIKDKFREKLERSLTQIYDKLDRTRVSILEQKQTLKRQEDTRLKELKREEFKSRILSLNLQQTRTIKRKTESKTSLKPRYLSDYEQRQPLFPTPALTGFQVLTNMKGQSKKDGCADH